MGKDYIRECEEAYLEAAKNLDRLDLESSELWLIYRRDAKSDQQATHMVTAQIGPYWNELKAKLHIAKLRLEKANASTEGS